LVYRMEAMMSLELEISSLKILKDAKLEKLE
jgi:hypothetical protein